MKLFLFDLDGTLVSTGGAGLRALDRAFVGLHSLERATNGISPAGKTDPFIVREIFETKLGRPPVDGEIDRVCEAYLDYLPGEIRDSRGYRVMDGVADFLDELRGKEETLVGLGTGNLERGARIKLERGGLNGYFLFGGFGSDAEERAEVLRAGVRRAEERAGKKIAPRDVFVIGDTILDIRAGKAIGAVTVAVGCGHGKERELCASEPDHFVPSFRHTALGGFF
jgi:phosphoglycolate phosphatase